MNRLIIPQFFTSTILNSGGFWFLSDFFCFRLENLTQFERKNEPKCLLSLSDLRVRSGLAYIIENSSGARARSEWDLLERYPL